jgi:hypothetical protein
MKSLILSLFFFFNFIFLFSQSFEDPVKEANEIIKRSLTTLSDPETIKMRAKYEEFIKSKVDSLLFKYPELDSPTYIKSFIGAMEVKFKSFIEKVTGDATAYSHYSDIPKKLKNEYLFKIYSSEESIFDSTQTISYIKDNYTELKKIGNGNYELLFDSQGKLTNYKEFNLKNLEPNQIKTITDDKINYPLSTKISFSVVSNDSILVSTNYYSSTTKTVYFNNDSKSYLLKESPNSSKITISNDASINKKQLKIVYQYKNEKLVNGILVESVLYTKEELKGILKK